MPDAYAPNVTSEIEHELSPSDSRISQTPEIVSTVSKSLYIGSKKIALLLRQMFKPLPLRPKRPVVQLLTLLYHKMILMSIVVYSKNNRSS